MSNHEMQLPNELELVLLRSELETHFRTCIGSAAIRQSLDWERPTDIILAGTFEAQSGDGRIELWHRIENGESKYMIIQSVDGERYWHLVTADEAQAVKMGRHPMTNDHLEEISRCLKPLVTEWNRDDAENLAARFSPFDIAEYYK